MTIVHVLVTLMSVIHFSTSSEIIPKGFESSSK